MKHVRFILGLILLPPACVMLYEFFKVVLDIGKSSSEATVPFWLGLICYFVFQAVFTKPVKTYIFGHELTHALFGLLSGAKLRSFKVSSAGGSVELTKTNILITLAPYFVPVYTAILMVCFWLAGLFYDIVRFEPYFLFGVGFTLAFHFSLTHFALKQGQSDLKKFGVFFSSVFILIINCIVLVLLLKVLFPGNVDVLRYFKGSGIGTVELIKNTYIKVKPLWYSTKTR